MKTTILSLVFIVLVIVTVVVAAIALGMPEPTATVATTPTFAPSPTATVIHVNQLSLEYNNNGIAAHNKYNGTTMNIRGQIRSIGYTAWLGPVSRYIGEAWIDDIPTVQIHSSDETGYSILDCGLVSLDKVGNLSVGDVVTVTGKIVHYEDHTTVWLYAYPCSVWD